MAKKSDKVIPSSVSEIINQIAKGLGVAAVELWSIFVRQYLVRGITELFTGLVLVASAYFLQPYIGLWILLPLAVSLIFFYGAILLIGNPKYYAIDDISNRVKNFKPKDAKNYLEY